MKYIAKADFKCCITISFTADDFADKENVKKGAIELIKNELEARYGKNGFEILGIELEEVEEKLIEVPKIII